jgi:hypothetical protein
MWESYERIGVARRATPPDSSSRPTGPPDRSAEESPRLEQRWQHPTSNSGGRR